MPGGISFSRSVGGSRYGRLRFGGASDRGWHGQSRERRRDSGAVALAAPQHGGRTDSPACGSESLFCFVPSSSSRVRIEIEGRFVIVDSRQSRFRRRLRCVVHHPILRLRFAPRFSCCCSTGALPVRRCAALPLRGAVLLRFLDRRPARLACTRRLPASTTRSSERWVR